MRPFHVIAELNDGRFAVLSVDPTLRIGQGCSGIVQSIHKTRSDAEAEIAHTATPPRTGF